MIGRFVVKKGNVPLLQHVKTTFRREYCTFIKTGHLAEERPQKYLNKCKNDEAAKGFSHKILAYFIYAGTRLKWELFALTPLHPKIPPLLRNGKRRSIPWQVVY